MLPGDFEAMRLPAICEACGAVFPSGYALGGAATGYMVDCTSGPCSRCGGMGLVPNGAYAIVEKVLAYSRDVDMPREDMVAAINTIGDAIGPGSTVDLELLQRRLAAEAPSVAEWVLRALNSPAVGSVRDWAGLVIAVLAYRASMK